MESQDLVTETNALLRQIIERDEERKRQAAKAMEEVGAKMKEVSSPEAEEPDDFSKRMQAMQDESKQRMEEMRQKDLEYKELMLNEAKAQTALLRAIREKLQA